jgi:aspartate/methionine/tyrosine aminotransferase
MLPRLEYLAWAIENYGLVRYDLGTSGIAHLHPNAFADAGELLADVGDVRAPSRWVQAVATRFGVPQDHVVPTMGTTHGLWSTYAGVLSPGDEVLVERPYYEPLVRLAQGHGAHITHFERPPSAGAPVDPAAVARALTAKTRLVVISNLHNPTGAYVDDATIAEVASVAARVGAHVLVDEVYRDLVDYEGPRGRTAFHVAENVIVTSSLTKVYGLGWARAGWVVARPELASRIFNATLHDQGGTSLLLATAARLALERIDRVHGPSAATRTRDGEAITRVRAFLATRPHLSMHLHRGAIFGFVEDTRGGDLRPVIERAVREEQVIVAPGSFFAAPAGFRLRYGGIPLEMLDEGLARLGRVLDRGANA